MISENIPRKNVGKFSLKVIMMIFLVLLVFTTGKKTLFAYTVGPQAQETGLTATTGSTLAPSVELSAIDMSGVYNIRSKSSNLLMDVYNGGTLAGVNIIQWAATDGVNQKWRFELLDNGYYKITSMLSGMSLDVYNAGTTEGNKVIQWPYHGGDNQQWKIIDNGDGSVSFMSKLIETTGDNFILDVFNGSLEAGVNVIQWTDHDSDNQKWYMDENVQQTFPALSKDYSGTFNIKSLKSDLAMDVFNGGVEQGVNIIQWPYHGSNNQKWIFEDLNNGYYKITSVLSGMSLDVYNGGTVKGNRVIQWPYHGGTNQQWRIIEHADGTISLMSRLAEENYSYYVLDVLNGGIEAGVNVIQWTAHYGSNQKWVLNQLNPVTPPAPDVTRDDTANTVSGMATGMEYNLDGLGYVAYDAVTFASLDFSGNHSLLVRYAAEGINPFGPDTTLTFTTNPVTPPAPAVTRDDTANTVSGMTTGMEYNLDGLGYVAYDAVTFASLDFSGNHSLLVRYAAEGINPFGPDTTLSFTTNPVTPPAPAVTRDDTANTVSGMTTGMEYNLDGAGYMAYVAGTFNALNFSGNHTLLVRYAAEGINPFGPDTTLTFTTNPVTPPAPSVTRDDTANTVSGMATGMEYNLDGAGYVAYVAGTFNALDFSGNHTLLVRVAAEGINPFGPATTLIFTTNITLVSIEITTPATKTNYAVGDVLNITGLVVTGTYDDNSTAVVPITGANITGFNTSAPLTGQVLTITVGGKTATYTINIFQVILSKTTTSVILGNSDTLTASVLPIDVANQSVTWSVASSSNSATVNNGLITGVKLGIATVTATTVDGVAKASCFVTVTDSANLLNNFNLSTMQYMPGLILQFGDAVGMNLTDYNKLSASQKTQVQQIMVDASFATVADIKAVFDGAVVSVILDAINYATIDTMGAALEANASVLDLTGYNMLSMSEKTIVHGRMLLPVYFATYYTSFAEVQTILDIAVTNAEASENALAEINAATVDTIGDSLVNNAALLGLSLDSYNLYGDQATANATLESLDFTNAYDLQMAIDSIVLVPVWEIDYATMDTIANVIIDNATALGLDLTDYNALSPEEQLIVQGYLVNTTYNTGWYFSIPAVHSAFNLAVNNATAASIALAEINLATIANIDAVLASNAALLGVNIDWYDPINLIGRDFTNTFDLQIAIYGG